MTLQSSAQQVTARKRLLTSMAAGVLTATVLALASVVWQAVAVGAWAVAATLYCAWVWTAVHRLSPEDTARVAVMEDDTRRSAGLIAVAAAIVSLGGVAFGLHRAKSLGGWKELVLTALCVYVVAVSWTTVQTSFMLRYAHEYQAENNAGRPCGIDFPDPPDYRDFAYLAFTVGMTYQVSDTDIRSRAIRRTLLRHALLSYVFGTVIVAVTINVVAGIV